MHKQLYLAQVHLFHPCRCQGSVPCSRTVRGAHTSRTNWTFWGSDVHERWSFYARFNRQVLLCAPHPGGSLPPQTNARNNAPLCPSERSCPFSKMERVAFEAAHIMMAGEEGAGAEGRRVGGTARLGLVRRLPEEGSRPTGPVCDDCSRAVGPLLCSGCSVPSRSILQREGSSFTLNRFPL